MRAELVQELVTEVRDGCGLRQALAARGLIVKHALAYLQKHHRPAFKAAKREQRTRLRVA